MADLDDLVVECLEGMEQRGRAAIDEVCAAHPEHESQLRKRLHALSAIGLLDSDERATDERHPEQLGEFRLIERLGGGGMGVVYLAEQEGIDRRVALKVIRPDQLYFSGARDRFAREVETVARLQHPGIVPIHAVGEEGGVPYFAMQLVEGCTLDEALEELSGRDPRKLTGRDLAHAIARRARGIDERETRPDSHAYVFSGSWESACLEIVRQVADALAHAHERKVLHRDIKPSNVMVTPAGRAMLVDFGLASMEGSTRLTRSGSQLGSVPYMSPEQARGRFDELDARSDVYSLGVTLFELLTLHHPFRGDSTPSLLIAIQNGSSVRARALNPQLSWEAETVCSTATEVDPRRRYAHAADFVRDLQNAIERRPIEARAASAMRRTLRWVQRRPATAVALALGALLVIGGPLTFALQERAAARSVARQRDRAEENLGRALEAIERALLQVGGVELRDQPHMAPVRHELVETAADLLDGLAQQNTTPEVRAAIGRTRLLLAGLRRESGDPQAAHDSLEEGSRALEELTREDPLDLEARISLARALLEDGRIQRDSGALDAAEDAFRRSLETIAALEAEGVDDRSLAAVSGLAHGDWGLLLRHQGEYESAERHLLAAVAALDLGLEHEPDARELLDAAARARSGLGGVYLFQGRLAEAASSLQESLRLHTRVVELAPGAATARSGFAANALNLGFVRAAQGDPEEADRMMAQAATMLEQLIADYPSQPHHRTELGKVKLGLADTALRAQDYELAEWHSEDAVVYLEQLAEDRPNVPTVQSMLGTSLHSLGMAMSELDRDLDACIDLLERAVEHQSTALSLSPLSDDIRSRLVDHHFVLGELLSRADAEQTCERRAEVLRSLLELTGGDLEAITFAAQGLAECAQAAGERSDAARDYLDAAAAALRLAVEQGHADAVRELLTEPPFPDLAEDPAFRGLAR